MKAQKWIRIGLLAVLIAGSTACSKQEKAGGTEETKGETPAFPKLRFAVTHAGQQKVEASPNINEDKYIKKLREFTKTDVQIELIPWREFNQKLTLIFTGGNLPDLLGTLGINTPEVAPAVDSGVLTPLNDLIDKYAPNLKKHIPKDAWESPKVSKDGVIYGIPSENYLKNSQVVYIRKDWLDKLGLKPPKTIDEYVQVLRAFKTGDPNRNNKADEIPLTGRINFSWVESFFGAYDVLPNDWKYVNGQLVPNFIRPEMKQALALYKSLYDEKLLDNEFLVMQGKEYDAKIKGQGIAGMWHHQPHYPDKWLTEVKQNTPEAEIAIIPAPVGPDGKGGTTLESSVGNNVLVIPKSNKNPEVALKFLDWFYSDEAIRFITYGIEGEHYTVDNGKINYKYPKTQDEVYDESMRHHWLRFVGPDPLSNSEYVSKKPYGDLIKESIRIANSEGRVNDGLDIPVLPTLQTKPELRKDGLWMEFAAKVLTGKEPLDNFDKFVEDWKKRGGDQLIKEATDWYNKTRKK